MAFTKVSNTRVKSVTILKGAWVLELPVVTVHFFSFCLISPRLSVTVLCVMSCCLITLT